MKRLVIAVSLSLSTAGLWGQDTIPTAITPANNTGDLPYSTSIGTATEHLDLSTGNLIVNIPFVSVPGRHLSFDFGLRWDARFWMVETLSGNILNWNPEQRNWLTTGALGWTTTQGYLTYITGKVYCYNEVGQSNPTWSGGYQNNSYIFTDVRGNKHSLPVSIFRSGGCALGEYDASNYTSPGKDMDGVFTSLTTGGSPSITASDGTFYGPGGTSGGTSQSSLGLYYEDYSSEADIHGNTQVISTGTTDSIGRTLVTQQTSTNQITYQIPDSTGSMQPYIVDLETVSVNTAFGQAGINEYSGTRQVVQDVILPNQTEYKFQYNSWGEITHVDLPTGASVDYQWNSINFAGLYWMRGVTQRTVNEGGRSDVWNLSYSYNAGQMTTTATSPADATGTQYQSVYTFDSSQHLLSAQYLASPGGTQLRRYDLTWDSSVAFPISSSGEDSLLTSLQTTVNGLVSRKTFQYDLYSYQFGQYACNKNPYSCEVMASSGQYPPPSYLPPPTFFPGSHGNVTTIQEYDWGQGAPGPLIRQTIRKYLHDANNNYFVPTVVAHRNIANRVVSETIYDGSVVCTGTGTFTGDGEGTITPPPACQARQLAQSVVTYDNGTPQTYGYLGDATSISKWIGGTSYATYDYHYDSYGNLTSATDPDGNTTTVSYDDAYSPSSGSGCSVVANSSAYPTVITDALQHQRKLSYYKCTGRIASDQGPNDLAAGRAGTTFVYDSMGRVLLQAFPDQGSNSFNYTDTYPNKVTTTKAITGSLSLVTTVEKDALGRDRKITVAAPEGPIYTRVAYDELGRKYQEWNPTRCDPDTATSCPGETTFGYVTHVFDALDRQTIETEQDGTSRLQWCYNGVATTGQTNCHARLGAQSIGTWVDLSDENQNDWQRTIDALGRLTEVMEPNGGNNAPVMETDYTYDVLGNLVQVDQWGGVHGTSGERLRSFTYDNASRLITSTNPEAGTICYGTWNNGSCASGYDANGNMLTKTDARGVITTYSYDALNRMTAKMYAADTTNSPISCFQYDASSFSGSNANLLGKLTNEWTQKGGTSCTSSGNGFAPVRGSYLSLKSILAYDPMGRPTGIQQQHCLGSACSAPTPYLLTLGYDLSGNLTALSNSVGAQGSSLSLFTYYDAASRPCLTTSSWASGFSPNLFQTNPSTSTPGYWGFGGLQNWYLGSSSATASTTCSTTPSSLINPQQGFDSRLRIASFSSTGQVP